MNSAEDSAADSTRAESDTTGATTQSGWGADRARAHMAKGLESWNARDSDRVLALVTEDILWEDPSIPGGSLRGKPAAREWMESLWRAAPDLTWESLGEPFISFDGSRLAGMWRVTGHLSGPMRTTGWAPTGRGFELTGFEVLEFDGGLVRHEMSFADMAGFARQVGVLPQQGSAGDRVMTMLQRLLARLQRQRS